MVKKRGVVQERVLRILLNDPSGTLSKYRMAKEAGGSYPWIHELLGKLEKEGLVKGTQVKDFNGLMMLWRKWYVRPGKREYMLRNPLNLLRSTKLQYALTTYQAENIVQNYLFPSRVDFYILPGQLAEWHRMLLTEGLVGRGNTRVLLGDELVFYRSFEKNGLEVVSLPQLIVDLLVEGGVCVEAAENLMEKVSKNALPRL